MFIVWAILAGLYGVNFAMLVAQGDPGGALVVGFLALLFTYLSRRSYRKRGKKLKK